MQHLFFATHTVLTPEGIPAQTDSSEEDLNLFVIGSGKKRHQQKVKPCLKTTRHILVQISDGSQFTRLVF